MCVFLHEVKSGSSVTAYVCGQNQYAPIQQVIVVAFADSATETFMSHVFRFCHTTHL